MACKISTAPINISTAVNQPCKEKCEFYYDYGNSSCSVVNQSTYLDIKCFNGINSVSSGLTGSLYVTSVRLYRPSLNTYDGFKADAELIITHSGGGKNFYVCVPVISSEKESSSAKWFSQIIPYSPSEKGGSGKSVNVSNFSLNSVVPLAPFFIYEGGTFDWGCSSSDIMIIFNKNKAINIKNSNYKTLVTLISKHSYSAQATPSYLTFNATGTSSGPGKQPGSKSSKQLTCTPIVDQDGNNIEGNKPEDMAWEGEPPVDSEETKKVKALMWRNIGIVIGIILGILAIWLIGMVFTRMFNKQSSGTGGTGAGASGGSE